MAKRSRCDNGQKRMKRVTEVAPNVLSIQQRTIRKSTSFFKYFFKNRSSKLTPNFSRC
jgi:hypothetical protein